MLQTKTVAPDTLALLKRIQAIPELMDTRLVGGTALALHLGHRKSTDLDFFGEWDLELDLSQLLAPCGTVVKKNKGTRLQFFDVADVKCDFVSLYCPWLFPAVETEGVRLADIRDIAAMKIHAITNRGRRRDFVDLAELLRHLTMDEMVGFYLKKYPDAIMDAVFRSLAWFDDADKDKDIPFMFTRTSWETMKNRVIKATGPVMRKWTEDHRKNFNL